MEVGTILFCFIGLSFLSLTSAGQDLCTDDSCGDPSNTCTEHFSNNTFSCSCSEDYTGTICDKVIGKVKGWSEPPINGSDGSAAAQIKIPEDLPDNTETGVTLVATRTNETLSPYNLTTDVSHDVRFSIDANTGVLTKVSGTLDFETHTTYVIVATATSDQSTGTATVTLSITDVNESPVFVPAVDAVIVGDGTTAGTEVYTVTATDPDNGPNGIIAGYNISGGNTDDDFTITTTGVIKVSDGKTLNTTRTGTYILQVIAEDQGPVTGTATIAIILGDCSGVGAVAASFLAVIMALACILMQHVC